MSEEGTRARVGGLIERLRALGITRRPKLWIRVAVGLAALTMFVVLPGYLAQRPEFLQRYAPLSSSYDSWSHSVHAKVACQRCHIPPSRLSQTAYDARMLGEFYLSIVMPGRQPAVFDKPTNDACRSCHVDLRTVSPSGDLNIPHRAHVEVLRLQCIDCHKYLVHQLSPEGTHKPWMAGCLRCHDGRKAKNDCSACHTAKVEPLSHRAASWLVQHPQQAQAAPETCRKCHAWKTHWCAGCHAKRPRSHGTDWRSKHGAQVKLHRNCEACHVADFCSRCHGAVPQLNLDPNLKLVR